MPILSVITIGCAMVALTVAVHAIGSALMLRWLMRSGAALPTQLWPITWMLIRVTLSLILIHLTEVTVWAMCYLWQGCFPDAESALYFSGASYTTIGYGDLVLANPWRLLGPIEGLIGILMCGISAGLLFALMNKIFSSRLGTHRK